MSNKSPFEIRADLLKLAQEHLESQYKANVDFATKSFQLLVAQGKEIQENIVSVMPQMFTISDIMEKAREMYAFVKDTK